MSFLGLRTLQNPGLFSQAFNLKRLTSETPKILQVRCYAARKGTRERKKKAKVKVEIEKVGFIPHNQRDKDKFLLSRETKKFDDSWKREPVDDVYVAKYYKWIVYPFADAIQCHRESHHPEIYNKTNANVYASIELNMQGEKKTRFVDNFTRMAAIPNRFDHGEIRTIIAFSKSSDMQKETEDAGAQLSGGADLIKKIQNGEISLVDFQYIVAHPDILPELVVLRGLMKKRFPSPRLGTLDVNLTQVVERFVHGISYTAKKDDFEKDFGLVEAVIGKLNMGTEQLEENFASLIRDVYAVKPRREGHFITRSLIRSPPSPEKLKVDHNLYLNVAAPKSEDADEQEEEAAAQVTL